MCTPAMEQTRETADLSFCKILPKVELHAHLNGSISPSTMERLARKKVASPSSSHNLETAFDAVKRWQSAAENRERRTLGECFQTVKLIHSFITDVESVAMVTCDVIREFAKDGVRYLELRSTPRDNPEHGMTKKSYIEAVLKGISDCEEEGLNIIVKFLPSIDRRMSIAAAEEVVSLASEYRAATDKRVVGVDLSGDPDKGDVTELIPILQRARNNGLKLAIHLAERSNRNKENRDLIQLLPDRIGHGTFLHPDVGGQPELIKAVARSRIPIETCLTSNLIAGTVQRAEDHHFSHWYTQKHPCILCTDDKGVFATSLSEEYLLAASTFNISPEMLWSLSEAAIDCIFAGDETKTLLRGVWKDQKNKLGL